MKILITSAANKVPLLESIKKTTKGIEIIAADVNKESLITYFAQEFWEMPYLKFLKVDEIIRYCNVNSIMYILPTSEADILYFSENKERFIEAGINVLVSNFDAVKIVNDKFLFSEFCIKKSFPAIPTYLNTTDLTGNGKYILKERFGAGSKNILLNLSKQQVEQSLMELDSPIIQPMISGIEYSVDLYITKYKRVKAVVVRKRSKVVDGESQITEIVEHPKLEALISEISLSLSLEGHVMFQAFEDAKGEIWIIECNARIGGASTLSIYAGLDTFNWWLAESNGENIEAWSVEIKKLKQIRYKKDLII